MTRRLPKERRFKRHVFVSMPSALTSRQKDLVDALYEELDRRRLYARTIGVTDFGTKSPLALVRRTMAKCHGALILGLIQGRIDTGTSKPGPKKRRPLRSSTFPTPWNQLEAGIAYAMDLPLMIVKEVGICGGIFDPGAVGDHFVHSVDLGTSRTWRTAELKSSLDEWNAEVICHAQTTAHRR